MPIQGFLTDDTGVPVDGTTSVTFKVYDAETGGAELHSQTLDVAADAGAFTAYLTPDLTIFEDNQELYLGLAVDGGDEMSPRLKMATVPYAAVAGNAASLQGMGAADFAPSDYQPDWGDLQNVPSDISDGDDGASYTGTSPVTISANDEIGLITACPDDNVLKWDASNGQWSCAADEDNDTTYSAGSGVEIDGNNAIGLNSSCSTDQLLEWDGTQWACETDDDTTYLAGNGLNLTSNQFEVDTSTIQSRVTGTCPNGEYVMAVNQDGTVVCGADADTTYSAGSGLSLSSGQFSADTSVLQSRVTGSCSSGEFVMGVNADGSVVCGTDQDTDTNTTYSAGSGLAVSGTTFSVNTSAIQSRVTGTCPSGEYVMGVNADGTVVCGTDQDTDTNTTYSAGNGLDLSGTTFSVEPGGITSTEIANGTIRNADINSSANIAPAKINGTAATLNGGANFNGDVEATGFDYDSPRTGRTYVAASQFEQSENDEETASFVSLSGYIYPNDSGSPNLRLDLDAPIDIPQGATVTEFNCLVYDNLDSGLNDDAAWDFNLMRVDISSSGPSLTFMATSADSDTGFDSPDYWDAPDNTISRPTIDKTNYAYHITGYFEPDQSSASLRFYGCYVDYEVTSIEP